MMIEEKHTPSCGQLTAKIEPFDSFWEGPEDVEKGYDRFFRFYKDNYLKYFPKNKESNILVISCGPGYFVNLLDREGYKNILGIDSCEDKIKYAKNKELNCIVSRAFEFLDGREREFDVIFCEQEINHLTKDEIIDFLDMCWRSLKQDGILIVHALNGANPVTGSEALAQNFDHYNTFTEYTIRQVLSHLNYKDIKVIPLNLYVFYKNPLNYILMTISFIYSVIFRLSFMMYGKNNKIFTKKIAAICRKSI